MTSCRRRGARPLAALALIICLALALAAAAAQLPRPKGPVADYAKVIPPRYQQAIANLALELWQKTGAALVVATVPSLEGRPIEEVAVDLFERWGIGQKGKDNGVLILIAPKEHKLRIEVGYGLEGVITDVKAGMVRDVALVPYLKKGEIGKGLYTASAALANLIAEAQGVKLTGVPKVRLRRSSRGIGGIGGLLALLVVFFFVGRIFRGDGRGGGGFWGGMLLGSMLGGGFPREGGSGGGFDSFGGGFGGFGGGMSGGGGASGGW